MQGLSELEQKFIETYIPYAHPERRKNALKRKWANAFKRRRPQETFKTKTLPYIMSLEKQQAKEFFSLATQDLFLGEHPLESMGSMTFYLVEVIEYQQEQQRLAKEKKQADIKMMLEAKKQGIYPKIREEYHPHRNPHLINKIAPEIWGFLSLENSQDRLDAYAFLIMDRWAHYFPQTMKTKDQRTIMSLIKAVIEQTKMETKALDRMEAQIKRAQGVSDMELLQEAQVNQYHYLLEDWDIRSSKAWKEDWEVLKQAGMSIQDFYQI
ncbi:hypothetical protein HPPN120_07560 [Helicobacter pylori Puno120]|nr:hypothetical protein HPPN120_07560 [Helicobacter pylori Puno120]